MLVTLPNFDPWALSALCINYPKVSVMSLILLYLGEESKRFTTEEDAKIAGAKNYTTSKPARIEITPDGGGIITTITYDPITQEWIWNGNN